MTSGATSFRRADSNSGRFLDPPEFQPIHDKGNEENIFDRVDYQISQKDTVHGNFQYTRSWFQTPNTFDNLNVIGPDGLNIGDTDQRSKIGTFNIAPTWTRLIGPNAVFTFGAYVRQDQYNYYPSNNPFADLGPINSETISQSRRLTNAGVHSDYSWVKGIHNVKAGVTYQQTFLNENDEFGIIDPTLLPSTLDANGNPCFNAGTGVAVPGTPCATLLPIDLTRGGSLFDFRGSTDVKELSMYVQDTITKGAWSFNLGIRGDLYNGLSTARQAEPRVGIAYNIKPTNTVLRVSYARTLETPFNENLIIATEGCNVPVIAALIPCVPANSPAGYRNEFHAGLQQAFGKHLVIDGEYIWKYTHNAYDFSVLGNTPITFPIDWHNSKIPGFLLRASVPNWHGFSALVVMSSVAARYFPPQIGGLGVTVGQSGGVFRIDHDEKFNQTTHLQYQPLKRGPWIGFNWRYDSGLVAGAVTDYATALTFDADQQAAIGLFCGSTFATPTSPILSCPTGTTAWRNPRRHPRRRHRKRRQESAAHRFAQLVRLGRRPRQPLQRRPLQVEPPLHRRQPDQQRSPVQLPLHIQRHALRNPARRNRRARLPLLVAKSDSGKAAARRISIEISLSRLFAFPTSDCSELHDIPRCC